jgi:hypothetical protein
MADEDDVERPIAQPAAQVAALLALYRSPLPLPSRLSDRKPMFPPRNEACFLSLHKSMSSDK